MPFQGSFIAEESQVTQIEIPPPFGRGAMRPLHERNDNYLLSQ